MLERNNQKIKNPLLKEERLNLKASSKLAKKLNLLEPKERQLLYQTGHFDQLFPWQLEKIYESIDKFYLLAYPEDSLIIAANEPKYKEIDGGLVEEAKDRIFFEMILLKANRGEVKYKFLVIEYLFENFYHYSSADEENDEDDFPVYPVTKGYLKIKRKELGLYIIDYAKEYLADNKKEGLDEKRKIVYIMMANILEDKHYDNSSKLTKDKITYYQEAAKLGSFKATAKLVELSLDNGSLDYVNELEILLENSKQYLAKAKKEYDTEFLNYFDAACYYLGYLYDTGCNQKEEKLVEIDLVKSFEYFYKSSKNLEKIIKEYKEENSDISDMADYIGNEFNKINALNLSYHYEDGDVVDENLEEADYWRKIAYEAGYEDENEDDFDDYEEAEEYSNKGLNKDVEEPPMMASGPPSSITEKNKKVLLGSNILIFPGSKIKNKKLTESPDIFEQLKENKDFKIRDLIKDGENETVEFKASFRWDTKEHKLNKILELVVIKEIVGLMNHRGGYLLIGVDDSGKICGIEHDINSFVDPKDRNLERFINHLSEVINNLLGIEFKAYIKIDIFEIDGKSVCCLDIEQAELHCKTKTSKKYGEDGKKYFEQFYVRSGAQSRPLNTREAIDYVTIHFPNAGRR